MLKRISQRIPEDQRGKVLAALRAKRDQILNQADLEDVPGEVITARFDSWNLLKAEVAEALGKRINNLPESVYALFGALTTVGRADVSALLGEAESEA